MGMRNMRFSDLVGAGLALEHFCVRADIAEDERQGLDILFLGRRDAW